MRRWGSWGVAAGLVIGAGQAPAEALPVGRTAPAFTLPRLIGEGTLSTEGLRGKSAQLVVFWASECGACREEAPKLQRLAARLKGRAIAVVAVNAMDDPDAARRYVRRFKWTYPTAADPGGEVARRYQITQTPTVLLIDRRGVVRYHHFLLPSWRQIEQVLK
jgi:peroxiredoxin